MRILVQGEAVARSAGRLEYAAASLAARGHDVLWWRGAPPAGAPVTRIEHLREAGGPGVDAVIGAGVPWRASVLAWRSHARVLLLGAGADTFRRWSVLDGFGWDSLPSMALIAESDAGAVQSVRHGVALDRVALWPAADPLAEVDAAHEDVEVLERAAERMLARATGRLARPAAFVDRDGTLVIERGYLADPDDIELLPGVAAALRDLRRAGIPVVVVSNQSGVGRGLFPLSRVYAAMARLRRLLRAQGVELDGVYFCPHRPDAGCACRKPGTQLLERAAEDLQISLRGSLMIGDKRLDAATGQAAGGFGALVRTGYGRDEESRIGDGEFERAPDRVFDGLPEAAAWFVAACENAPHA